ncbi:MAG TPA: FkbM family methyltransferase [Baekduia sp.]|uniref:FkbM family methyltransferase n=1 Tax=Baekduia sp. TaxID=2600305 RepID=UPI002D78D190|nr:FkbM family methyltransferase [Baekduia sp.]HET6509612.1 FkbM family methyltransferase [Baekduia sp.]
MSPVQTTAHARAIERFEAGAPAEAAALLRDAIDAGPLNDLAVMLRAAGDHDGARTVLEAARVVAPEDPDAAANLAALAAEHVDAAPDARRAALLRVVGEAARTHLADNVDHLFDPWGAALPDPAGEGERIARQLAVLDRCDVLWDRIGDEASRALLLRFLAYRALGPAHVRLQLDPVEYRRAVIGMTAKIVRGVGLAGMPGMPFEWAHHLYDFTPTGTPLVLSGPPLPLASTIVFSQYAYRDEAAAPMARPRAGDVALDVGGCWGETALWMATLVGPSGRVHCFEPGRSNLGLLADNLERNPGLISRVSVHTDPLGSRAGEEVWFDDAIAASTKAHASAEGARGTATPATTDTIDAMVARGALDRVDFIKMDVEGAELEILKGAAHTLRTQQPRLALATYHRPDDVAVFPAFLASLGLEYRWYLQCSTMTDVDTIVFGVPAAA